MIRWAAWVILLTGIGLALIWLIFQRGRRRLIGVGLLVLFLITFVPPFSYEPDPLGIVLAVTDGYRYDPRLPLVNRFLIASDPTELLRPTLDALIGQTGLDPLDPASPLARYDFIKVVQQPYHTEVHVRFTYADGREHIYPVPLRQPSDLVAFYECCWRYDGLGRLRTDHRPLPPVAFDEAGGAVLRRPEPLPLPAIDSENPQMWFSGGSNPLNRRLLWSPQGDAFLAPRQSLKDTDLWLLSAQGADARRVAANV